MSGNKTIVLGLMVLVLVAGSLALAYARWTSPISHADAAVSAGQFDRALAEYAAAETRFNQHPAAKGAFNSEYNRVVANELWLLYRQGNFDAVVDEAERAPDAARPHFWAGCALFQKVQATQKPQERRRLLSSAQQELHDAIGAEPLNWDAKYDFEMIARLLNGSSPRTVARGQALGILRKEPSEYKRKQVKPEG